MIDNSDLQLRLSQLEIDSFVALSGKKQRSDFSAASAYARHFTRLNI